MEKLFTAYPSTFQ